jgi:hypothetical protein
MDIIRNFFYLYPITIQNFRVTLCLIQINSKKNNAENKIDMTPYKKT